jgi:hypothetical protein
MPKVDNLNDDLDAKLRRNVVDMAWKLSSHILMLLALGAGAAVLCAISLSFDWSKTGAPSEYSGWHALGSAASVAVGCALICPIIGLIALLALSETAHKRKEARLARGPNGGSAADEDAAWLAAQWTDAVIAHISAIVSGLAWICAAVLCVHALDDRVFDRATPPGVFALSAGALMYVIVGTWRTSDEMLTATGPSRRRRTMTT